MLLLVQITWAQFEELWNRLMMLHLEHEHDLATCSPDMSNAQSKFNELDVDGSKFLEGF